MRWTVHLPRESASVPMARRLLVGAMETAGVDREIAMEIGLALSEACANVVEHARSGSRAEYQIRAGITGNCCRVEIIDGGPGFPSDRLHGITHVAGPAAENGRGLMLIRAMTDHVQLSNHPRRGAVLRFEKTLRWRKDALVQVS
ncbi:ATP-binding protein [Streptomyces sp. SID3343]|uniref:ATP-binding protein n=1 Tax=Streptomyces sp. SID3343 TaxID=2690260 RepID=UPI0031F77702